MPIVHTNRCNCEIKLFLKRNGITYTDLADAAGYSKGSIDQWMIKPLSPTRQDIIQQAIDKIMKKRPSSAESVPAGHNSQLRKLLMEQDVSYSELSRKLGKSSSSVWNRLYKAELTDEKKVAFVNAIESIVAERRSLHED